MCISKSLWTTYITENSLYLKFVDTVGPVQRVYQWHTYPTWTSPLKCPTRTSIRSIKCRNLWMSIQTTSVPLVTAELLQSNKRADCLILKKPTRATNYKKILLRSSIFVRDSLLLLKLNCDWLDRICGLRSNRGNKQEPDTKLTWMNNWNEVGWKIAVKMRPGSAISINIRAPTFSP